MGFKGVKTDELIKDMSVDKDGHGLLPRPTDFRSPGSKEMGWGDSFRADQWQEAQWPQSLRGLVGRTDQKDRRFQEKVWEMKCGLCCRGL